MAWRRPRPVCKQAPCVRSPGTKHPKSTDSSSQDGDGRSCRSRRQLWHWLGGAGSGRVSVALLAVMLAIVAFLALYAVPETVRLGRVMDFADDGSHSAVEQAFWRLHHSYTGLDMAKFGLGLLVAGLVWRRSPSGN